MTIRLSIARATRASGRQCQPVPAAVATNAVSVALAVRPPPRGDPPVPSAPLSRLSRRAARAATRQRRDGRRRRCWRCRTLELGGCSSSITRAS